MGLKASRRLLTARFAANLCDFRNPSKRTQCTFTKRSDFISNEVLSNFPEKTLEEMLKSRILALKKQAVATSLALCSLTGALLLNCVLCS